MLYFACAAVVAYAAWNLWQIQRSTEEASELYDDLAQKAGHNQETAAENMDAAAVAKHSEAGSQNPTEQDPSAGNEWITDLQAVNSDLVAWIKIPDTNIDYPVMQSMADGDYYLDHDFERKEQAHGTPFLDVNCDVDRSENLLIYGHHMKDGTMFQNLMRYKEAEYCEENGRVFLYTPEETREYQVQLVMLITSEEAESFPYYKYIDLSDKDRYREYLDQCREYSIWESEESVEIGTPLLTLSTCEYSRGDGRLVVIATSGVKQ